MVGDTLEADILGAHRAGLRSVWIRSRKDARQEERGPGEANRRQSIVPDAEVARLPELPECLMEL